MSKAKHLRNIAGVEFNLQELAKLANKGREEFNTFSKEHFWQSNNPARQAQRIDELWNIVQEYVESEKAPAVDAVVEEPKADEKKTEKNKGSK